MHAQIAVVGGSWEVEGVEGVRSARDPADAVWIALTGTAGRSDSTDNSPG